MAESAASSPARRSSQEGRTVTSSRRSPHLAILRGVQHGGTQLADSRQRARGAAFHCPSSFADESGFSFQCSPGSLRVRILDDPRVCAADSADPGYNVEAAREWRPFAKLEEHSE